MKLLLALLSACVLPSIVVAEVVDLTKVADPKSFRVHNREAKVVEEAGKRYVRFDARSDAGMAWLVGSNFNEGTIDIEIRGKDLQSQSFIGLAFRGVDDTTYDAVYFRPFNFRHADVTRRQNAVQYISRPAFNWDKLRSESPAKYEKPVSPVPDPNGWFRARIVLEGRKVSVFVNDSPNASLVVDELSQRRGGMLGLWVDNGSAGDFASLVLTPKR